MINKKPAKLILTNGEIFEGYAYGKKGITMGEVCFNTGMTGYQEIITDPSYKGQIITMTYPQIGNYGINNEDVESEKIHANGLVIREGSPIVSNYRSTDSLDNYLKNNNIIAIQGVDTRALTKIIRQEGAMNAIISSNNVKNQKLLTLLKEHPKMDGLDLAKEVSCKKKYTWKNKKNKNYKIAAIDYGIKHNILNLLYKENCSITIFPSDVSFDEILLFKPDGIFLSNGPGDPAAVTYAIDVIKKLITTNIPIFGICLGHQLLALASGAKTFKLKFGHRGCNHPVKNHKTGAVEITSQNHGFSVDAKSLPDNIHITHSSLNDNTLEGIQYKNKPIFSVQYHPESSPGPHDSRYLFSKFIKSINSYKKKHA